MYKNILLFDMELRRKGFSEVFEYYSIKYYNDSEPFDVSEETRKEIVDIFTMLDYASAWYPKKADCIHKTLLGYKILRTKFLLPADMVVGVCKFPFSAHAWLKIGDSDIFNEGDEVNRYKIILRSNIYIKDE